MQPPEDADEVLDPRAAIVHGVAGSQAQAAGEDLLAGDDVGGPIEGVTAVVDGAAALGGLVDGAQELPLAGAHLRAGGGGAGGFVEEEADDQVVALVGEEAAEFVEPQGAVDALGLGGDEERSFARDGVGVVAVGGFCVAVVQSFEVFLELEGGIELRQS